jgi:hypothetical protein
MMAKKKKILLVQIWYQIKKNTKEKENKINKT